MKFFIVKSEIRKFKSGIPLEKFSENLLPGKASGPLRNIRSFPKKCNQKSIISVSKTWKIHKVQKCPQKVSRSLKSRDMSNLKISQNSEIGNLERFTSGKDARRILWRKRRLSPSETLWFFSRKWYQKTMISDSKTWIILKIQKLHQKASRSL